MGKRETVNRWLGEINPLIAGRTIREVRYMTDKEQEQFGWHDAAPVLILDNGHLILASADDEGNNAGALFTTFKEMPTIPVI